MPSEYAGQFDRASAPGVGRVIITPADTDLAVPCKAIRVRNEHASAVALIKITDGLGEPSVIRCRAGEVVEEPCQVTRVWETDSTVPAGCTIIGYVDRLPA